MTSQDHSNLHIKVKANIFRYMVDNHNSRLCITVAVTLDKELLVRCNHLHCYLLLPDSKVSEC